VNRLIAIVSIAVAAAFSTGASAGELSGDERSELRQRAEEFQSQRARNPEYQPGEGRLSRASGDAPARAMRASGKAPPDSAHPETRRQKAAKKARSLKNIPGAFVRKKRR
jgi:hypothetical protein